MNRLKKIIVFGGNEVNGDWPSSNALAFVEWFIQKLDLIPMEYQKDAWIDIQGVGEPSYSFAHIDIYYYRPETDIEMSKREARDRNDQEAEKASDLRILAALKAKYENGENK